MAMPRGSLPSMMARTMLGARCARDSVMRTARSDRISRDAIAAGLDLVDNDHVNPPLPDLLQKTLQGRPLHRAAREATIVVAAPEQAPALVGLALHVGPAASRWLSSELNSWSSPCSVETRV